VGQKYIYMSLAGGAACLDLYGYMAAQEVEHLCRRLSGLAQALGAPPAAWEGGPACMWWYIPLPVLMAAPAAAQAPAEEQAEQTLPAVAGSCKPRPAAAGQGWLRALGLAHTALAAVSKPAEVVVDRAAVSAALHTEVAPPDLDRQAALGSLDLGVQPAASNRHPPTLCCNIYITTQDKLHNTNYTLCHPLSM